MADSMKNRAGVEYICCHKQGNQYHKVVSQTLKQQQEALQRGEPLNQLEPLFRNDVAYSDREKDPPEPCMKLCMVVGYTPR